jgi:hypothetical protein
MMRDIHPGEAAMNMILRTLLTTATAAMLAGCVVAIGPEKIERAGSDWSDIERETRRAIDDLALGMRIDDVRAAMPNTAAFSEAFVSGATEYRVLFYRTQRVEGDGATTRDETTPLVFADGELVGWGPSALADATGGPTVVD